MYNTKELPLYKAITKEEDIIADELIKFIGKGNFILDIGCGSGSIALKLKNRIKNLRIDAVELDVSQIKTNYVFDRIYNVGFEEFEFERKYDIVLLSHVLGHFDLDFRYKKLLNKIFSNCPDSKLLIVTNAVIDNFKSIQNIVWEIANDDTYFIDLKKLLNPYLKGYQINFFKLTVSLYNQDFSTFYRLLETFSPIPLPNLPPLKIKQEIQNLRIKERYNLEIPQFIITVTKSYDDYLNEINENNLNHKAIWQSI